MPRPRFIIGLDLGTTNSTLAFIDTSLGEAAPIEQFAIPQVVQQGEVAPRNVLPSFLYLPGAGEQPAGALGLPWAPNADFAVGEFARNFGSQVPTRLVTSAKSWLCHSGVDRKAPVLPWKAPEGGRRVSPLEATSRYLRHMADAWDHEHPKDLLAQQDVVLTVPASFDAAARELTVEAAKAAGLFHLTLLEEPQAAFYSWLDSHKDDWRNQVKLGELILVADVGGGTTDFTLIQVGQDAGNLMLTRLAVGDHILLGGDNMDLALAHTAAKKFAEKNVKLDAGQMQLLTHSARKAKETLLGDKPPKTTPVTVLGRGSKVVGGTLQTDLSKAEAEEVLVDGFFPKCDPDASPVRQRVMGLQELGLPYSADPGVTKHLADFLRRQAESLHDAKTMPSAVLFNGGAFRSKVLRERFTEVVNSWHKAVKSPALRVLGGGDLDLAVSRGAAYYGLVRRGTGIRIRGGTARAYYIGIETAMPAVPGGSPPIKALCVAPFGMEEGSEADVPNQEFGLVVGEPVQFRFLGSTVRRDDPPGSLIEDWEGQIDELAPLSTVLSGDGQGGKVVPVRLQTKVTELGLLEVWCRSRDGSQSWKLEFNARDK